MGISIKKVMGWALTDVQTQDKGGWHPIEDPRINAASRLLTWDDEPTRVEYLNFLIARDARLKAKAEAGGSLGLDGQRRLWALQTFLDRSMLQDEFRVTTDPDRRRSQVASNPRDCVIHQAEYGDPTVLLLRPLSMTDWARRDDPLDYAQEALTVGGMENRAIVMPHAPYPFSGSFMDAATGEKVSDEVMPWVRLQSRLREEPDLDERERTKIRQAMDLIATEFLGFETGQDAVDRIAPCVPGEIRALIEFGDLFTSDDVWRQLRPVLYTYWS